MGGMIDKNGYKLMIIEAGWWKDTWDPLYYSIYFYIFFKFSNMKSKRKRGTGEKESLSLLTQYSVLSDTLQ